MSFVQVLVRGRLYTVRGKGKSAFLMIRQRTATVQVRGPAVQCNAMQCCMMLWQGKARHCRPVSSLLCALTFLSTLHHHHHYHHHHHQHSPYPLVQAVMFADDTTVSKTMAKYATLIHPAPLSSALLLTPPPLFLHSPSPSPRKQAVMFADDTTVSKTMVKYACGITKESIVDVEGVVAVPAQPIESATQKNVSVMVVALVTLVTWGCCCCCADDTPAQQQGVGHHN
jgi:hypothetical protein